MQPARSLLEAQWPDLVAAVLAVIDLEATARAAVLLVRRRAIRSAETLLRLALAYGPGGLSLRAAAAAWAGASALAGLSDTAVMVRSTAPDAAPSCPLAGRRDRGAAPPRGGRAAGPGPAAGAIDGCGSRMAA